MKKFPTISIVIATYNSGRTIEKCLQSIRDQKYPQHNIQIILADGGSQDATREIAKQFNTTVIAIDPLLQNAEYNKSVGIKAARHEILAMIDHDNVLPHPLWLAGMVEPFVEQSEVVAVETLRYHYDPTTTLIDRYFALFGAADPLVWYMGKTDRLAYMYDTYNLAGEAKDFGHYYLVTFQPENIPTIGANGFLVRRKILMEHALVEPGKYFDMDVNVDLIKKGYNTYAFVKDTILHLTGYGDVLYFLQRRLLFLTQYRFGQAGEWRKKVRRYGELSKRDTWRLLWAIVLCATCIVPLWDSFRGWRKIHDTAWFLHPLLSFCFVVIYSWAIIKHQIHIYAKKLLGT